MKSLYILLVSIFSLMLVACGENATATSTTPDVSEVAEDTTEYREYKGEGKGQGVIKSDDELEALEEEAYSNEDTSSDTELAETNSTEETNPNDYFASASTPFVSAFEFCSNGNFDIVGWLEANGCQSVLTYDLEGHYTKDRGETAAYVGWLCFDKDTRWGVGLAASDYPRISSSDEPTFCTTLCIDDSERFYTDNGNTTSRSSIEQLDFAMRQIKENPFSDDPLNGASNWTY